MNLYSGLSVCLLLLGSPLVAPAAPTVHKCIINGTVTFQQDPCPSTAPRQDPSIERLNAEARKQRDAIKAASDGRLRASEKYSAPAAARDTANLPDFAVAPYRCDGRTHCSQMSSCSEAKYFLANCPGVKMDGNRDGIPCEQQWCGR